MEAKEGGSKEGGQGAPSMAHTGLSGRRRQRKRDGPDAFDRQSDVNQVSREQRSRHPRLLLSVIPLIARNRLLVMLWRASSLLSGVLIAGSIIWCTALLESAEEGHEDRKF
jgi:hypothetical protein